MMLPKLKQKKHEDTWKSIKLYLDDIKEGEDISFDGLLLKLKVTEENYLLAIRSSINTPTVFLKRNPNELRINNYNPACLSAWRTNMDIQYVLDVLHIHLIHTGYPCLLSMCCLHSKLYF